jgi:DNA (cytosine-5)-methyltransferase 1
MKTERFNGRQLKGWPTVQNEVRVGSLFAAIGGFVRAFQEAGARPIWANEKDRFAVETFRLNFPDIRMIHKPVEDLSALGDKLEPVDVLTAGFPCQPFSVAGDKLGFCDDRGMLFLQIIRIIKEFGKQKPKVLLLENVRNLREHDRMRTFKRIQSEIQKAGYWFSEANAQILNTCRHTEIPQNRERIFMVALSSDHFVYNDFEFPKPLPEGAMLPVRSFLDLRRKAPAWMYFEKGDRYYPHFANAIAAGGTDAVYQLRRNYVRRNMTGTCFTLMANMGEGGHNQPVIKDRWGIRKLTPVECARLQGYEDSWFRFPEALSYYQSYKQVGNSVTIPLVRKIAEKIIDRLEKVRLPSAA